MRVRAILTPLSARTRPDLADRSDPTVAAVAAGGVEVSARRVRVGQGWAATLAVVGYPAQICAGWTEPLTGWPGRVDVATHVQPIPGPVAAAGLRRQLARLEAARRADADPGRLAHPGVAAAAADPAAPAV